MANLVNQPLTIPTRPSTKLQEGTMIIIDLWVAGLALMLTMLDSAPILDEADENPSPCPARLVKSR